MSDAPSLLVVGAHPDDSDIKAGGIAAKYVDLGRNVTFLSMTDGSAGHHEMGRDELARRRERETEAVAETLGIDYELFDVPDGELEATLATRKRLVRFVRDVDPDLVLGPRPGDYHPDHRYCATLLRDAAYMLIVPNVCPDVDPMDENPVFGYVPDGFEKPAPFDPDVVVDVDDVWERKLDALHRHESQVYEWLPYTFGVLDEVPDGEEARREWLGEEMIDHLQANTPVDVADRFRETLGETYGEEHAAAIDHAEAVEISEYGHPLTEEKREQLFPF